MTETDWTHIQEWHAFLAYGGEGYVLAVQQLFGRFQTQTFLRQDTIVVA